MTAASPWSVKGIDPKAREVAKDLARRSGMTLGEWLNQMIIEGEADAPPSPHSAYDDPQPRHDIGYRGAGARDYSPPGEPFRAPSQRAGELQRITRALDQLSQRMEAAEHRSTLAISGIDQSVMGVLSRIEAVERDQGAVAARFDGALDDVRQTQAKSADRVRRLADDDAPRLEAMKALESALGKVAEKLYEGEAKTRATLNELREDGANLSRRMDRTEMKVEAEPAAHLVDSVVAQIGARLERAESKTSDAVRALEASFAGLDARLKTGEIGAESSDRRFERLTEELSDKVEAARTEMAERLRDAVDGKLDRMEAALRDLAGHVEQGERRSAQAIDRMGREVMRIASTLGERVGKVEARSAEAAEHAGGEMARIADAIEQRMGRQDAVQAQALEKLGGEIGRIAEKLAERIAGAERRSAQSIDDVSDQLGRVTERLNQRSDRTNAELADRIAQSEARTAKLLEEAQGKIDARLSEAQRRAALEVAAEAARKAAEAESAIEHVEPKDHGSEFAEPFGADAAADAFSLDPFAAPPPSPPTPPASTSAFAPEPPFPPAPAAEFSPFSGSQPAEPAGFGLEPFGALAPQAASTPSPERAPTSNREMLNQARAAARSASERPDPRGRRGETPVGAVEVPPLESDARAFGFGLKKKKKDGVTIRTALVASGTAAALAVTGVGAVLLVNSEMSGTSDHGSSRFGVAPTAVAQETPPPPAPLAAAATDTDAAATPAPSPAPAQMAVALAPPPGEVEGLKPISAKAKPGVATEESATPEPKPAAKAAAGTIYSAAVRKIESSDPTGLEDLKRAANLGHPAAQFYLAKLYETGGAGVKKDLAEARRWTERAALGGDTAAMHNLGLYYYEGEAGPQDSAKAAQWFRKAADQGVKDSQYNLALLYAKGYGVAQNPAEAYKWYLIAAANGDEGAKSAAQTIRAQLTPETQAAAERSAAVFHAQAQGAVRTASNP
jgi:localization factor PodJL